MLKLFKGLTLPKPLFYIACYGMVRNAKSIGKVTHNPLVVGSSPTGPTNKSNDVLNHVYFETRSFLLTVRE